MIYLFKHLFILHLLAYFVFVCVSVFTHMRVSTVWRSADNLWDLILSCHRVYLGDESQVGLLPLSHVNKPTSDFVYKEMDLPQISACFPSDSVWSFVPLWSL